MDREVLKPFKLALEVRFNDLDGMAHVNNALFHTYVEQARCEYAKRCGLWSGERVGPGAFPLILARTEMDFEAPATWPSGPVEVWAWTEAVGRTSFTQGYAVHQAGRRVASAKAVLVWYDYAKARPEPLPAAHADTLRSLIIGRPTG